VREAVTKEGFAGLRTEIERLALGTYFAECLEMYAAEGQPEPELLQLGLNCLYALSEGMYEREKIKAAFELRLMSIAGYAPAVENCAVCGKTEPVDPVFLPDEGVVVCRGCRKDEGMLVLTESVLSGMRYILSAPAKKILGFSLPEADLALLGRASEIWVRRCSGREIGSLEYYRKLE